MTVSFVWEKFCFEAQNVFLCKEVIENTNRLVLIFGQKFQDFFVDLDNLCIFSTPRTCTNDPFLIQSTTLNEGYFEV